MTGQFKTVNDIPRGDFKTHLPRFQAGNFENNVKLVSELEKVASKKGCTPAQLAIGWLRTLSKRDDMPEIYPIPGAVSIERIKENATNLELTDEELNAIDSIVGNFDILGDRWPAHSMVYADG